jgi:hypothetical protein
MVIWNRDLTYRKRLTAKEREEIARSVATPGTIRLAQTINTQINIWVPVIVFWFTNFNLMALAAAFIATDIVLCAYDHLRFVVIPHFQTMRMDLSDAQKRLERVKNQKLELDKEIERFEEENCSYACRGRCEYCTLRTLKDDRKFLTEFIHSESEYIDQELQKVKEAEIQANNKQSRDYADKRDYFNAMRDKLTYFIGKHDMEFLAPVLMSVNSLLETLEKRPLGYEMVPNTIYIYLDELQKILTQISNYDEERRSRYEPDVDRIAKALSKNIEQLNDRIERTETADVEVSIAVLLKDLTNGEEEKNV